MWSLRIRYRLGDRSRRCAATFASVLLLTSACSAAPSGTPAGPPERPVTPIASSLADGTGTFQEVGPLAEGRSWHAATLLADGRVLITGGESGVDPENAQAASVAVGVAEVFDPATGAFTPTGALLAARFDHTATLLPDGRVLVAGGRSFRSADDEGLASSELYDPASGVFSPSADLMAPRARHQAAALADGRVLIVGGSPAFDPAAPGAGVAEIYDPSTGRFERSGALPATLLVDSLTKLEDGRVLVVGSMMPSVGTRAAPSARPRVVLAATPMVSAVAYLFDPATGDFAATGAPLAEPGTGSPTSGHTGTLLADGRVLLAGGENASLAPQLYDAVAGTFTATGAMVAPRAWHTAARLPDGRVLLAGGYGGSGALAEAELYDPPTGAFTSTGPMRVTRMAGHTATLLPGGDVLVVGGASALPGPGLRDAEVLR